MTDISDNEPDLLIERREGAVSVIMLNRPDAMNALNSGLMRALLTTVSRAAADETVRCVVLTGAGRAFCAGGDTRAMAAAAKARQDSDAERPARRPGSGGSSFEKRVRWVRRSAEAARILHEMSKPTIAMINGACAGAGLSLAAACDFRIAGESAKLRSAFVPGGVSGDYGGAWLWTQILGTAKARQLYLIDAKRNAAEALAFGLVDEVREDDALEARVMELAGRLASLPGQGAAYAKENLNAALHESFAQSLDRESRTMLLARNAVMAEGKAAK